MRTSDEEFDQRRTAALGLLAHTGIWRANFAPPFVQLQWKLGIRTRPPHFASFVGNTLSTGLFFGAIWSLFMWLFIWEGLNRPRTAASFGWMCRASGR